jgi:hypothetical protein
VDRDPTNLLTELFIAGPEFFFAGWPVVVGSIFVIASVGYGLVLLMNPE